MCFFPFTQNFGDFQEEIKWNGPFQIENSHKWPTFPVPNESPNGDPARRLQCFERVAQMSLFC